MSGAPHHSHAPDLLCLLTQPPPTEDDWVRGYYEDRDTRRIIKRFADPDRKGLHWSKKELKDLDPAFCQPLRDGLVLYVHNRLILMQPMLTNRRAILLIIPPACMRQKLFEAYHATPVARHMGICKMLHRLCLQFFWPKMRQSVTTRISECAHCVLANSMQRVSSKLLYSFSPDEPFAVIHVDLWSPGKTVSFRGTKSEIVKMDDVTGVVLVVNVDEAVASNLARLFFKHVLLVVGICCMVVVNNDSKFKVLFEAMCNALGLRFHVLAKKKHKAMRVEHFNHFLNTVVMIEANNWDTNRVFPEATHVAAYAWNLAPIDGTDIIRSYPAFGRVFHFLMNVELGVLPVPTFDNAAAVTCYLEHVSDGQMIAMHVLQILRKERAIAYREQLNEAQHQRTFSVGDMVSARIQAQSKAKEGKVSKLLYKSQGPMMVVEDLGKGAYNLRHADQPCGVMRQHLAEDMFPLPLSLHPCKTV